MCVGVGGGVGWAGGVSLVNYKKKGDGGGGMVLVVVYLLCVHNRLYYIHITNIKIVYSFVLFC